MIALTEHLSELRLIAGKSGKDSADYKRNAAIMAEFHADQIAEAFEVLDEILRCGADRISLGKASDLLARARTEA